MASIKEYRDFILEQLSEAPNITCRPMMGEFMLYSDGLRIGNKKYESKLSIFISFVSLENASHFLVLFSSDNSLGWG